MSLFFRLRSGPRLRPSGICFCSGLKPERPTWVHNSRIWKSDTGEESDRGSDFQSELDRVTLFSGYPVVQVFVLFLLALGAAHVHAPKAPFCFRLVASPRVTLVLCSLKPCIAELLSRKLRQVSRRKWVDIRILSDTRNLWSLSTNTLW